ncbi:hypothetical protein ACFQ60_40290 [Streptomyces zhihengii]
MVFIGMGNTLPGGDKHLINVSSTRPHRSPPLPSVPPPPRARTPLAGPGASRPPRRLGRRLAGAGPSGAAEFGDEGGVAHAGQEYPSVSSHSTSRSSRWTRHSASGSARRRAVTESRTAATTGSRRPGCIGILVDPSSSSPGSSASSA